MIDKCLQELNNIIPKDRIFINEPMIKHTAIKIGGPAEVFVKATTADEIRGIVKIAEKYKEQIHIVGNGSNILVKDDGIKGIVINPQIKEIKIEKINQNAKIIVGSGVSLGQLAYKLLENGITGFEELSGIPGTIGGAIRMNAGAHGKEMKDVVNSTTFMDNKGNIFTIEGDEHQFKYRSSIFAKEKHIILNTTLILEYGDKDTIKEKINKYQEWRKENQPIDYPNAGSTFKRGDNFITAKLIDECGLKGFSIGGAQVSTKHAGFVVNTGNATSKDVLDLVEYVKEEVYKKTGKKIELEVEVI